MFGRMAEHIKSGVALVIGGDEVPRSHGRVGEGEHVADGGVVGIPLGPVTPVFGVDFVLFIRGVLARAEAHELFVFRNLQPIFDYDGAMIDELPLKVVDFVVGPFPFVRVAETLNALDQNAAIPGAIKNSDEAIPGDLPPESP